MADSLLNDHQNSNHLHQRHSDHDNRPGNVLLQPGLTLVAGESIEFLSIPEIKKLLD